MTDRLTILTGDCVAEMDNLEAGSVALVVTSPPYDSLRRYNGFTFDFEKTAHAIFRVLCDGGVCCWNVGDSVVDGSETLTSSKQKIYFREQVGFRIHDTMIYQKNSFSHPETTRYHSVFEYVFVLSKGAPKTFNPIKDKPNSTAGQRTFGTSTFARPDGTRYDRATQGTVSSDFGMRHNVWKGKTRGQEEICQHMPHPAMMPKWLARDLILSFSNLNDLCLDPMAGSGTVGKMAIETGRRAIMIDSSPEYAALIRQECDVTPGLALA